MKNLSFALILLFSLALMQSCQKDPVTDNEPAAPELPAKESFVMPFEGFEDADTNRNVQFENWFYAASNLVVWNTVLTLHLVVPTASFYESFNHDPEFQGNSTWLWDYQFSALGGTYQAELYGELLTTNEVKWDMYISKNGAFSQVHWYTGTTANDGSYANWTLNFDPLNPKPFLSSAFVKDDGNGTASIRYTNIVPNNPDNGDYIEYRANDTSSDPFNRAYDVFKIGINNLMEVNWNSATNEGRVKDENHFQDMKWHCWGEDLKNANCL